MKRQQQPANAGKIALLLLTLINVVLLRAGYTYHPGFYWPMLVSIPLLGFFWYRSAS